MAEPLSILSQKRQDARCKALNRKFDMPEDGLGKRPPLACQPSTHLKGRLEGCPEAASSAYGDTTEQSLWGRGGRKRECITADNHVRYHGIGGPARIYNVRATTGSSFFFQLCLHELCNHFSEASLVSVVSHSFISRAPTFQSA